jgi:hypothetical protein
VPDAGAFIGGALSAAPVVVGAALALGGLWMLLRRLRSAPVALGVIAIGAALMSVPRLRPAPVGPPEPASSQAVLGEGVAVARSAGRTVAVPLPAEPPPLPGREATVIAVEGREAEPNDTLAAANRAPLGVAIVGTVGPGENDWFAFDVPAGARGTLVANLTVGDASAALGLYDDAGQTLGIATTFDALSLRKATLERDLATPRYFVLVRGDDALTGYHLTLAVRR